MLREMVGEADRVVVVDVETTGLSNSDRVVEIAAVTVEPSGTIVDEWDTLVDPRRDVGPTHIHGVTASMVSAAPRFDEIAAVLADRLHGAVLVSHNRTFDARMLANEFSRVAARFVPGAGLCTLQLGGGKLTDVCRAHDVEMVAAHRALGDARASAQVLTRLADRIARPCTPAQVSDIAATYNFRTLQREMVDDEEVSMPYLARLASEVHHYGEHGATLAYLDLLDRVLADLVISDAEQRQLDDLVADLGLSSEEVAAAHRRYVDELIAAAVRDGIVTDEEHELLHRVARALNVAPSVVDEGTVTWRPDTDGVKLVEGMSVCFTGSATYPDGSELPRTTLEKIAGDLGLTRTRNVSKNHCDLLVAADTSTQSGKAATARNHGIPLVDVHDFVKAQPGSTVPTV